MLQLVQSVLRVPGGFHGRRISLTFLLLVALIVPVLADDAPKMLPFASTAAWRTSIITTAGSAPLAHDYSAGCPVERTANVDIPAGAAKVHRSPVVCAGDFGLLPAPSPRCETELEQLRIRRQLLQLTAAEYQAAAAACVDPSADAVLTFNDGVSTSSFTVPPMGPLHGDRPVVVSRPMISDDEEIVVVTVFPKYPETPIYITLQDARSLLYLPIVEKFKASPPVAQYVLEAKGLYWINVLLGYDDFYRCWPSACEAWGNVYGFVANGTPAGGSLRVSVFGGGE